MSIKVLKAFASKDISQGELLALNRAQAAVHLSGEQLSHARTRAELLAASGQLQQARAEMAILKGEKLAGDHCREAQAEAEGALKRLEDLTADIRRAHNLTEKHAIDGLTGAVLTPEI